MKGSGTILQAKKHTLTVEKGELLLETTLLAGKIMIENGADMARVDDTLKRIAQNSEITTPEIFETTTGIMMSIPGHNAQVKAIARRQIDLERIAMVNEISRAYQAKQVDLTQMHEYLKNLDKSAPDFKLIWLILGAGTVGATLEIMYGGSWSDLLPTFLISALGYYVFYAINTRFKVKFASEFLAALVIGLCALFAVKFRLGQDYGMIIIGSVMPLVPGVPLTNAVRDLLAGHILSGSARVVEALLTAVALGMGIACVLRFWKLGGL